MTSFDKRLFVVLKAHILMVRIRHDFFVSQPLNGFLVPFRMRFADKNKNVYYSSDYILDAKSNGYV